MQTTSLSTESSAPLSASALAQRTLGDIAVHVPGATAVFRRYRLDFCCGGGEALATAAARKGIAVDTLTGELADLRPGADRDVPAASGALIDYIIARYHDTHRRDLPELIRLAHRVEAVHRGHPDVPAGLAAALETMEQTLGEHMHKEEKVLFPMMRAGGNAMIGFPIERMRAEHDEHGEHLRRLDELTHGGEPPADACPTWRALYAGTRTLTDELMEHIHLENNLLFPRFAAVAANHE
jgi:regulator of cell morphogenesis and NO signaling